MFPLRRAGMVALLNLLILALLITTAGIVTGAARADTPRDVWLSSADPPADYPPALLMPPDPMVQMDPQQEFEPSASIISHRVPGSVLRPRTSSVDFTSSAGGGCTYLTSGPTGVVWNLPLHLPNGSQLDSVRMYYDDTSPSTSRGWLTIYDLYGDIVQEWGVSSSGSSGNGYNNTGPIDHTVDYSSYNYVLNWRPSEAGSDMQLCGFRVYYEPPPLFGLFAPTIRR